MGFPTQKDLDLKHGAEEVLNFSDDLIDWVNDHGAVRRHHPDKPVLARHEFELFRL